MFGRHMAVFQHHIAEHGAADQGWPLLDTLERADLAVAAQHLDHRDALVFLPFHAKPSK